VRLSPWAISLCPKFFKNTAEEQVKTMVHESAHLAGIRVAGEQYCNMGFSCGEPCPGTSPYYYSHADNWAQFVHCAGGRKPDLQVANITASAKQPKKPAAKASGRR
jgi:hypothetical protein